MGRYDLYGNYYSSSLDAENAEMAQCSQIDSDLNQRYFQELREEITKLQQRVAELEKSTTGK